MNTTSPLRGKKLLFAGDSICEAYVEAHRPETATIAGWAGRIPVKTGALGINISKGGASLSDIRKTNTVIAQLEYQTYFYKDFDMVVLHGGVNDGWDEGPVGEISPSFEEESFDFSTFAGGLEKTIFTAKKCFPTSKISFIINQRTPSRWGKLSDMSEYWECAKKICEKWNVPYLDLYSVEGLECIPTNNSDHIHPNTEGYDMVTPYITKWLEEII